MHVMTQWINLVGSENSCRTLCMKSQLTESKALIMTIFIVHLGYLLGKYSWKRARGPRVDSNFMISLFFISIYIWSPQTLLFFLIPSKKLLPLSSALFLLFLWKTKQQQKLKGTSVEKLEFWIFNLIWRDLSILLQCKYPFSLSFAYLYSLLC